MAGEAQEIRVLVVDDEPIIRDVLARYLSRDGFAVDTAADGAAAIAAFETKRPDLVVLDLMLPRIDGFEVLRRIRVRNGTAVIILTAKGEETDRVVGLELGADDYVAKPFSPREVVARVRAVLRRADRSAAGGDSEQSVVQGDLVIDPRTREVRLAGRQVSLTLKEFDLLHLLASSPRKVFSRLELIEELWDIAYGGDPSTVTVHIRRLREKIETDPSNPDRLVTVWGVGYKFEP